MTADILILALATWRLSSLFANESGPFHIFSRFRERVCKKLPGVGEGLVCEWCNSIWFGTVIVIAYYFFRHAAVWVLLPLAFSTAAVVIKHIIQALAAYTQEKAE